MPQEPAHQAKWQEAMNRSRLQRTAGQRAGPEPSSPAATPGSVSWLLMFGWAAVASILAWIFAFIPVVTATVNFLMVLVIWLWAEHHGLRPPTLSSALRKAGGKPGAAVNAVQGSNFLYRSLGGITPLVYLLALWWNNRP